MSRAFRGLVLWLMALAIPVQGIAANLSPFCVTVPAQAATAAAMGRAAVQTMLAHSTASGAGVAGHGHDHAGMSDRVGDRSDGGSGHSGHSGHSDPAGHSTLKCCSAGFSMATLASPDLMARSLARPPAPVQWQARLHAGVIPDGLDRPPRTLRA